MAMKKRNLTSLAELTNKMEKVFQNMAIYFSSENIRNNVGDAPNKYDNQITDVNYKEEKNIIIPPSSINHNKQQIHLPIDFVLVCEVETYLTSAELSKYMENLNKDGLETAAAVSIKNPELIYILIHISPKSLKRFAHIYDIEFLCRQKGIHFKPKFSFKCMKNDLTLPLENNPVAQRNREILEPPTEATSAERIIVVNRVLACTYFTKEAFGYPELKQKKVLIAAYPLHDGDIEWTEEGPLCYRQVLYRYWGNCSCLLKYQPLNVIEKYFGPEVAMYCAWFGFYNEMLAVAALVGLVFFLLGIITYITTDLERTKEICSSNTKMCPICRPGKKCKFVPLSTYCGHSKVAYFFDNTFTFVFAVFMAFWGIVFLELWKRKEALLKLRWNLLNVDADAYIRPKFPKNTKYRRINNAGEEEAYVPRHIKFFKYTFSVFICGICVFIILIGVYLVTLFNVTFKGILKRSSSLFLKQNFVLIVMITCSILSVMFIKIFGLFYGKICMWLTIKENPRTQIEFDESFVYKLVALSFTNVFVPMFYVGLIKSSLNTTPADWSNRHILLSDVCSPAGCVVSLCFKLLFLFLLKGMTGKLIVLVIPPLWRFLKIFCGKREHKYNNEDLPQWEKDYELVQKNRFFLVKDYMELAVTQYGVVTFFVGVFPLGPLYALFNNMFELRLDANSLLRRMRRPIPRRLPGIGIWSKILLGITWLSIVTNALIISFTSEFIKREIYRYEHNMNLSGFIDSTLSEFAIKDYKRGPNFGGGSKVCYYVGTRNGPNYIRKYKLKDDYYKHLAIKCFVVVAFTHLLFIVTGILAYAIPDMPYSVKERLEYEQNMYRELKIKYMEQKLHKELKEKAM